MTQRCSRCPLVFRLTEACPSKPEFLLWNPVKLLTESPFLEKFNRGILSWTTQVPVDFYNKNLYRQGENLFRPQFFGQPSVDEVMYYTIFLLSWVFELFATFAAVVTFFLIPFFIIAYAYNRKPRNLRVFIILVHLKFLWAVLQSFTNKDIEQPSYTCLTDGHA